MRIVAGTAAGGQSDRLARLVAQGLEKLWGDSIVVEARAGADGTIAAEFVARAPADGYTLLLAGQSNLALVAADGRSLRYDPVADFAPIGRIARVPLVLAINAGTRATTVAELISIAKAAPGTLTYGSTGIQSRLAAELFKAAAASTSSRCRTRSTPSALADLLAARIDMVFFDASFVAPHAEAGTLRLLAAAGTRRVAVAPLLPTLEELGFRGVRVEPWYGLVAPAKTPPEVLARLRASLPSFVACRRFNGSCSNSATSPSRTRPEQFSAEIASDIGRFAAIVKAAKPGAAAASARLAADAAVASDEPAGQRRSMLPFSTSRRRRETSRFRSNVPTCTFGRSCSANRMRLSKPGGELLSDDEKLRADRFVRRRDRARWIVAHGVLRHLLGRYCGVEPRAIAFVHGAAGKPSLAQAGAHGTTTTFNLAHSHDRALLAVSRDREIGVDLEQVRDDFDPLPIAREFFFGTELAAIQAAAAGPAPRCVLPSLDRKGSRLESARRRTLVGARQLLRDVRVRWLDRARALTRPGSARSGAARSHVAAPGRLARRGRRERRRLDASVRGLNPVVACAIRPGLARRSPRGRPAVLPTTGFIRA